MVELGTGINSLRSLVFVRQSGSKISENPIARDRSGSGGLAVTPTKPKLSPQRIQFNAVKSLVNVQKNRTPLDRLIDMLA